MVTAAHQLPRFQLPARIRASKTAADGVPAAIVLADRLAALPGLEAVESNFDTLPHHFAAFLRESAASRALASPRAILLCRLSADGIAVRGLDNWAKHQVVMRGWGKLLSDRVLLFLPRNADELETCWSIIRHAYEALSEPSTSNFRSGHASAWNMPKFSRTTLQ